MPAIKESPRVGRKRTPAPPLSQTWHHKLARLVSKHQHGYTDAEIAARAGMNPTRFSHILSGTADPRLSEVQAILYAIGCGLREWCNA